MKLSARFKGGYWPLTYRLLITMKLTVLLTFFFTCQVIASGYAQRVTLKAKEITLSSAMKQIQKQTGYPFFLNGRNIAFKKVTVDIQDAALDQAMNLLLADLPMDWVLEDKTLVISSTDTSQIDSSSGGLVQEQTITGQVVDETGKPLAGATVSAKGAAV